jgi:hypothetical protein
MSSVKCPECGLVNFSSASECKRCHLKFQQQEPVSETSPTRESQPPIVATQRESPAPSSFSNQKASPTPPPGRFGAKPERLNALMILFALYLLFSVVVFVFQLTQVYAGLHSEIWKLITDPNAMVYIPGFRETTYFSALLLVLGIFASLLLLIPLLRRSHSFLKFVRVYLVVSFVYFAVEVTWGFGLRYALMQRIPINAVTGPMLDQMYWVAMFKIIGFMVAFTWFQYFTTSDRVKRTFIK